MNPELDKNKILLTLEESLARLLTSEEKGLAYLSAALEEDDPRSLRVAVKNVIKIRKLSGLKNES